MQNARTCRKCINFSCPFRHAHFARCFMQQTDQLYLVKVLNFAAFECDGESLENFKTLYYEHSIHKSCGNRIKIRRLLFLMVSDVIAWSGLFLMVSDVIAWPGSLQYVRIRIQ